MLWLQRNLTILCILALKQNVPIGHHQCEFRTELLDKDLTIGSFFSWLFLPLTVLLLSTCKTELNASLNMLPLTDVSLLLSWIYCRSNSLFFLLAEPQLSGFILAAHNLLPPFQALLCLPICFEVLSLVMSIASLYTTVTVSCSQ